MRKIQFTILFIFTVLLFCGCGKNNADIKAYPFNGFIEEFETMLNEKETNYIENLKISNTNFMLDNEIISNLSWTDDLETVVDTDVEEVYTGWEETFGEYIIEINAINVEKKNDSDLKELESEYRTVFGDTEEEINELYEKRLRTVENSEYIDLNDDQMEAYMLRIDKMIDDAVNVKVTNGYDLTLELKIYGEKYNGSYTYDELSVYKVNDQWVFTEYAVFYYDSIIESIDWSIELN